MSSLTHIKQPQAAIFAGDINHKITQAFLTLHQSPSVHKTHLFAGRYENIYLNEQHIPELQPLIKEAVKLAEDILATPNLRAGYWFNYMPPGASTTLHTHDDDDELLSAVYYLQVPENSGNLIVHENTKKIEVQSKTGEFIFFKPDLPHEVSRNNSAEHRLSIGINFGVNKSSR